MLHLPKRHVVLKVFPENKLFHFSKKVLRNKWLKEALDNSRVRKGKADVVLLACC